MSIHRAEIESISKVMARFLGKSLQKDPHILEPMISHILNQNIDEEEAIEKEAEALFKRHGQRAGLDADKAILLIKKEIAKQKKFAL